MAQIVKFFKKVGRPDGATTALQCSSNAAVTAGRLVEISSAASTIVPMSYASVAMCAATSTGLFGIAMQTTSGNGIGVEVIPVLPGDLLDIEYTSTAPTPGARYGLHTTGQLIASNTTGAYALYKVMSVKTTTSRAIVQVLGLDSLN